MLCTWRKVLGRWRRIVFEFQDRPCPSPRDLGAPAFENVQAKHGKEHQDSNGSYNQLMIDPVS